MTLSASIPMNWAVLELLNWMPSPSLPKSIPMKRNRSSVGVPNFAPDLAANIATIKIMENSKTMLPLLNRNSTNPMT